MKQLKDYHVFLSSTFSDLIEHRKAVQAAIKQLGAVDVSMEHFGARDERPADECIRLVREESDLFVGIYAHRYGYIPENWDISISEVEYRTASDASLPRFIYMVGEGEPWLPAHIDGDDKGRKLRLFKEALLKRHICQTFGNRDQLAAKVVADIGRHIAMENTPKVKPVAMENTPKVNPASVPVIGEAVPIRRSAAVPKMGKSDEWNERLKGVLDTNRAVFMTHVIRPSSKRGQKFDVFIYLMRHGSDDLADVRRAEFFLGPYWGNEVFAVNKRNGFFGISTSAYGTFLGICRVTFDDGYQVYLQRYIDFEMQRTGGSGT
jgi:hypothetical protein